MNLYLSVLERVTLKFLLKDVLKNMEYDESIDAYVIWDTKESICLEKDEYEQIKSLIERL